jgi:hypothetical protein
MKYTQRSLWPQYDDDAPLGDEAEFVKKIVCGLGVPEQYADSATIKTFSDGAVSLRLNIDLSYDDVESLRSVSK